EHQGLRPGLAATAQKHQLIGREEMGGGEDDDSRAGLPAGDQRREPDTDLAPDEFLDGLDEADLHRDLHLIPEPGTAEYLVTSLPPRKGRRRDDQGVDHEIP